MKLIAVILSLCFTMNVMAATVNELEKTLDNYQYALTVEWDQKNEAFYEQATNAFFSDLTALMKLGMTKEALLGAIENKLQNKELMKAISVKLNLMGELTPETLSIIARDEANNLYASGASWNGQITWQHGLIVLVVAAVGYSIWFHATHKCTAWNTHTVCGTPSDRYGYQCWDEDYCENYEKK